MFDPTHLPPVTAITMMKPELKILFVSPPVKILASNALPTLSSILVVIDNNV